jgi:sugar-specific transcriptional regulator TrmB
VTAQDQIVSLFVQVGLTRNEALAYLALLESPEEEGLTGYEVAARSGIPRSAVYAVMRKLETARACFTAGDSPARYRATAPSTLVADMRDQAVGQLDRLAAELARFPKRSFPEPIWTYASYDDVLARIDALIRRAERSVYLSLWNREASRLAPALEAVADRNLHRVVFSTDRLQTLPAGFSIWSDELTSDAEKATWSHKILAIVDRKEAVIGGCEPEADNHAVHTRNPSLVDVATNHVILDITLLAQRTGRDCSAIVAPMMRPHLL